MVRVGIRREDKNEWERRAPLTPDHVAGLIEDHGVDFTVQPSPLRAFPDRDYRAAGAEVAEGLADCRVVLGVKEIPLARLAAARTYVFFSHTGKAQAYNMPLLRRILDLRCTLLDYEHVLDERGRRLIFFGRFAGYAGMIDALWALGRRFADEGRRTPFERIRLAHDYASLDEATSHVARVGDALRHSGIPEGLRPIVFAFTGSGNVTRGAREIFERLPHVELHLEELRGFARDPERPRNVVYGLHLQRAQRYERIDGAPVRIEDLEREPKRFRGAIPGLLEHLSVLVHGAYWKPAQPRLLTIDDLRRHWADVARPKLRLIADVSCDVRGGIEATVHVTTPSDPVFVYDLERDEAVGGVHGRGPVVLAVDNLPCQLPVESSEHFGDTLQRFVPLLARCDWDAAFEDLPLPPEMRDAVIAHRGRLTPRFAHLARHLPPAAGTRD